MSLVQLLARMINALEKEVRAFLWGHHLDHRGLHLIPWEDICQPKEADGLRFYSLNDGQKALLGKIVANLVLRPHTVGSGSSV